MAEDLTPCGECGSLPNIEQRLWLNACAPIKTHRLVVHFQITSLTHFLVHVWDDEKMYAAVERYEPFTPDEMIEWIDRCHAGKVERHQCSQYLVAEHWTGAESR